jgi:hypothetical protein
LYAENCFTWDLAENANSPWRTSTPRDDQSEIPGKMGW